MSILPSWKTLNPFFGDKGIPFSYRMKGNVIVLEQASIELLPTLLQGHRNAKEVELRTGVVSKRQILDDNFHHEAMSRLEDREKRGRPDVAHFALLEVTSAPLYLENQVDVAIHTLNDCTIWLKEGVRLPRTLQRFNGVVSKILLEEIGKEEEKLFRLERNQSIEQLLKEIGPSSVISLTRLGKPTDLREFLSANSSDNQTRVWIVGGFAFGHFVEEVIEFSDDLFSISSYPLPAHVVTARLVYELERSQSRAVK